MQFLGYLRRNPNNAPDADYTAPDFFGALTSQGFNLIGNFSGSAISPTQFSDQMGTPPNQIDDQRQFVRQQYLDFLNREPDGPGWNFWTDNIMRCTDPNRRPPLQTETECISRQRETTSAAFSSPRNFRTPATSCCGFIAAHWVASPTSAGQCR